MSKTLLKYDYFGEFNHLNSKVKALGKTTRVLSKLKNVNTTGLSYPFSAASNVAIDKAIEGPCGKLPTEELNGIQIYDEENELCFIRIKGNWKKISLV